jgi:hypothetical protein
MSDAVSPGMYQFTIGNEERGEIFRACHYRKSFQTSAWA